MSRIDALRSFIESNPKDPFPRYALAQELRNGDRMDDAWEAYRSLMDDFPDYVATYLHAGNTLVTLGRSEEARQVYQRGIDASTRVGDVHARGELEGALEALE